MKQVFTISTFLLGIISYGQNSVKPLPITNVVDTSTGFTYISNLRTFDLAGRYTSSNGYVGYHISLDTNQSCQKIGFDCISRSKVDSGKWSLQDGTILTIKFSNTTEIYEVIQVDSFYFIIPKQQKERFVKDYAATRKKFASAKPFTIDGRKYGIGFMIAYALLAKYYGKELGEEI